MRDIFYLYKLNTFLSKFLIGVMTAEYDDLVLDDYNQHFLMWKQTT